jgi:hypothetical protein
MRVAFALKAFVQRGVVQPGLLKILDALRDWAERERTG